jgi:hypothetical protein
VYLLAAENVSGPPSCRLSEVNQTVMSAQNRFSTLRLRPLVCV